MDDFVHVPQIRSQQAAAGWAYGNKLWGLLLLPIAVVKAQAMLPAPTLELHDTADSTARNTTYVLLLWEITKKRFLTCNLTLYFNLSSTLLVMLMASSKPRNS